MAGQFDAIAKINIGGTNFSLGDFSLKSKPVVEPGKGRTSTEVHLEGWGWVEAGTDVNAYGAAVASAVGSFNKSGQDVAINEWGGALVITLNAAGCLDGGPHINFSLEPSQAESPLTKRFTFSIDANQKPDPTSNTPDETYKVTTTTAADNTRQITISGDLAGVGLAAFYQGTVLPRWGSTYPPANWVMKQALQLNGTGDRGSYTISFEELIEPLPNGDGFTMADGETTFRVERDEQENLLLHTIWEGQVIGDPVKAIMAIRPTPPESIRRESYEYTNLKGHHIKAEFVQLDSGSGDGLLDFEQTLGTNANFPTYQAAVYPGIGPIVVRDPDPPYRYLQEGRAVGLGQFPKEPEPLLPFLSSPPVVQQEHLDEDRKQTTWHYEFFATARATLDLYKLGRPTKPQFYTKPKAGA